MSRKVHAPLRSVLLSIAVLLCTAVHAETITVSGYPSLQAAIDANPGRIISVPPGDYIIDKALMINKEGTGLVGPGRIIMSNDQDRIIRIDHTKRIRLEGLTLTRAEGKQSTKAEGIRIDDSDQVIMKDLYITNNFSRSGTIELANCTLTQILNCTIENYMTIAIDDRTDGPLYGYAFNCIDGTGMVVRNCKGSLIQGNTIIERKMVPTPEIKQRYNLGKFVKKNPQKGSLMPQKVWDEEYVNNWHQGSAMIVTGPAVSDYTRIIGNHVENAAQGIDIHSDHVIMANNTIVNSFIGMKAMHGSRNVIITGNHFSKNDLWAIGLMPGAGAYAAQATSGTLEAKPANVDGGHIVANNVISDFGYGSSNWIWKDSDRSVIRIDGGQEPDDPPIHDVLITGNMIYDTGLDQVLVDGKPQVLPPRYRFAVIVNEKARNLHFANNVFSPGTDGISNMELKP